MQIEQHKLENQSTLQWGHNFFVMEITTTNKITHLVQTGFNGAITFSLWKYDNRWPIVEETACFNGAITFSLWKFGYYRHIFRHWYRFNGAITFSLWKSKYRMEFYNSFNCFNGAITFSLWKLALRFPKRAFSLSLQWGHNFFVMEIQPD